MAARDDPLMLGLDAGTTRVRALAFAPDGTLVAEGSAPTPIDYPRPGWADYDPDDLWAAAVTALRAAMAQLDDPGRIVSLAAASVGESAVPLDGSGAHTSRAIAWFDKRTEAQVAYLERTIGLEALSLRTGMRLEPIGGLCKMLWFREHEPEAFARTRAWLHIDEFLAWKLSGEAATDHSLASRTLAMDIKTLSWADDMLGELGIPDGLFQPLAAAGTPLGPVTPEAAAETGLSESCTVAVGGHDHILGALAIGALAPGALLDSLGTAEAILFARDAPLTDPQLARDGYAQGVLVVEQPIYYFLGGIFTSGACVEWFRRQLADEAGHEELIAGGEAVPPGSIGVHFLPHFRIGSPPFPGSARGAFLGLSTDVTRDVMYRAILEGLAYDARGIVDGLLALSPGTTVDRILSTGGESRNGLLMRIKASVYDRPIAIVEQPEAVSLGAALLGGLAAGVYDNLDAALAAVRPSAHTVAPEPDWVPLYAERFANVFRPAHAALTPLHAAAVRDAYGRRQLLEFGHAIMERASFNDCAVSDQMCDALQQGFGLKAELSNEEQWRAVDNAVEFALDGVAETHRRDGVLVGVPTGLPGLDRLTGGLRRGELALLAARPGMGKSALAMDMAWHAAHTRRCDAVPGEDEDARHRVLYFSLEMTSTALMQRVMAGRCGLSVSETARGEFGVGDFRRMADFAARLRRDRVPLSINDNQNLTLAGLQSVAHTYHHEFGRVDLIVVDYLQLLRVKDDDFDGWSRSPYQEVTAISRGLRLLARDLDVPVLALSQLSRDLERRSEKRPQLSDLRESGALEQDAALVMFLYRPEHYLARAARAAPDDPDVQYELEESRGVAELIVAKQRSGPEGTIPLRFDAERIMFEAAEAV